MTPSPTPAELALLNILWTRGPSTVHEVMADLEGKEVGYTTVLKTLQVMDAKSLVTRDGSRRPHVFTANIEQEATQRSLLRRLADRAFAGSTTNLVLRALSDKPATRAQLQEIRELVNRLEREADE